MLHAMDRVAISALYKETVTLNGQPAKITDGGTYAIVTSTDGTYTGKWAWSHARDIIDRGGVFKV
jgi:hypothetical protein